jgi:hypothetical protein
MEFVNASSSFLSDLSGKTTSLFSSLIPVTALVIGIPLAFVVISFIIGLVMDDQEFRRTISEAEDIDAETKRLLH